MNLAQITETLAQKTLEIAAITPGQNADTFILDKALEALHKAWRVAVHMQGYAGHKGNRLPEAVISELHLLTAGTFLKALEACQEKPCPGIRIRSEANLIRLAGEVARCLVEDLYLGYAQGDYGKLLGERMKLREWVGGQVLLHLYAESPDS